MPRRDAARSRAGRSFTHHEAPAGQLGIELAAERPHPPSRCARCARTRVGFCSAERAGNEEVCVVFRPRTRAPLALRTHFKARPRVGCCRDQECAANSSGDVSWLETKRVWRAARRERAPTLSADRTAAQGGSSARRVDAVDREKAASLSLSHAHKHKPLARLLSLDNKRNACRAPSPPRAYTQDRETDRETARAPRSSAIDRHLLPLSPRRHCAAA